MVGESIFIWKMEEHIAWFDRISKKQMVITEVYDGGGGGGASVAERVVNDNGYRKSDNSCARKSYRRRGAEEQDGMAEGVRVREKW